MPGGERDAHPVLERRIGIVVQVQLDVGAAAEIARARARRAVSDVHDRMAALDRRPATPRGARSSVPRTGAAAADRARARPRRGCRRPGAAAIARPGARPGRLCDQRVERHDPVEVARVDLSQPPQALPADRRVMKNRCGAAAARSDSRSSRRATSRRALRDDLGAEDERPRRDRAPPARASSGSAGRWPGSRRTSARVARRRS